MSGRTTTMPAQGASRGFPVAAILAAFALVVAAVMLALTPGVAAAQNAVDYAGRAADELQNTNVYVDPDASDVLSAGEASQVADAIRRAGTPIYIAVLPAEALDQAGGDEQALTQQVAERLQRDGTVAVLAGDVSLGAGDNQSNVDAAEAAAAVQSGGTAPGPESLLAFVEEVRAQASGESSGGGGGSAFGVVALGLLLVVGGGLAFWGVRSKKRADARRQREFDEVSKVAYDDLDALGQDLRALDLDVSMPDADKLALAHYESGLNSYQQATSTIDRAKTVVELRPVSESLAEGRFQMACAKARLEGHPLPERRPPCFFDPRHGPSVEDVQWAPPHAPSRPVPVCASDAHRIKQGLEPDTRQLMVNGQMTPYYSAPGYYGPYAGGYYGSSFDGLFAGMLIGSMLTPGFGFGGYGGEMGGGDGGDGGGFDFGGDGGDGGGFDFGGFDF